MHLVYASILGLGQGVSSFGQTLALLLIFVVALGGLTAVLVGMISAKARSEHLENHERRQEFLAEHGDPRAPRSAARQVL